MKEEKKEYFPLSHPQYRIWYTEQAFGESSINNIGGLIFLEGSINYDKIKETLKYLLFNNVALNLRFTKQDGEPKQYIFYDKLYEVKYSDLSKCNNPQNELYNMAKHNMGLPFCLEDSSLYDFQLFKLADDNYAILIKLHHLIGDGWSISLIVEQINYIYSKLIKNEEIYIDSCSYLNYMEKEEKYLASERFNRDKTFWNEKYKNIPKEFQVVKNDICSASDRITFCLDEKETEIIRKFIKNKRISLNVLCIACMALYFSRTLDKQDITIGIPIYNRGSKTKKTIGMFTSTVALRLNIKEDMKFIDYLYYVDKQVRESIYHSMYPYNLLIKDCKDKGYTCNHLYDISVNYYNTQLSNSLCGTHATYEELQNGNLATELQLVINEWDEYNRITLIFDYRYNKYNVQKINMIYKVILNFLCSMDNIEEKSINEISLFSEEEKERLLHQFNNTETTYPKEKTIIDLIEEMAKKHPAKEILEKDGECLSYTDLWQKVNSLAAYLRSKGIHKQDRVCLITSHSFETVIGILAILKIGATYIPIDENCPIQRIKAIIDDSDAKMVITNLVHIVMSNFEIPVLDLSDFTYLSQITESVHNDATPKDIAYIIYTSGSTGKPKGVMISHKALVNYIWWAEKQYVTSQDDVFALYSSLAFDLTVTSIFTPLISATKMLIYSSDEKEYVLYRIMRENKVTIVKLTPSHLSLLAAYDYSNSNVKVFIVGGEELKVSLAKKIQENFGNGLSIYNEYGPTEATVGCMIHKFDIEKDKEHAVPIGVPADNVKLYVLNEDKELVYYDCIGELYISGDGVAEGYVNLDELTRERFVKNPFVKNQKMYKTGDLCRYTINGLIEYIGRQDKQVKINGFRIELQEIEKSILQIAGINDALVIVNKMDNNVSCLCAYLVLSEKISEDEIKNALRKVLPEYMIPTQYVYMESFPINSNGKVDKEKLPVYKEKEIITRPETEKEKVLVQLIEQVLEIQNVGVNQNYFNIGGDSIKAIQIVARLGELEYELKVKDILTNPIIKDMARFIGKKNNKVQIRTQQEEGEIQFTPIIQWFFQKNDIINKDYWNQSVLLEIDSKVSYDMVKVAIMKLINHHDILRLCFNSRDNKIFYNNEYLNSDDAIKKTNIIYNTEAELREKINKICEGFKETMDIEHSICFKALWIDIGQANSLLLLTANHLVVDGISWRILLDDFKRLLLQQIKNVELNLPMKTSSYKEWSEQLNEYIAKYVPVKLEYWNECDALESSYMSSNKYHWLRIENSLSENDTKKILYSPEDNNTLEQDEILLIALGLTLHDCYNTEERFVIEAEGHGREEIFENIDLTRTVGWFTIHYPILVSELKNNLENDIVVLKEAIRTSKKNAFEYMMLKYRNELEDKGNRKVRFNHMGDMTNGLKGELFTVSQYEHGNEHSATNGIGCAMEINTMILYSKLFIQINYNELEISSEIVQKIAKIFIKKLHEILDIISQNKICLTSQSDYQEVELTKDEFDMLFE